MLKIYWSIILCILLFHNSQGQHCPFDNTGLLVLEVIDSISDKKLNNITPFIIVSKQAVKEYNFNSDTLEFVLNPKQTSKQWFIGFRFNEVKYDFAQDNYILTLPMDDEFMSRKLELFLKFDNGDIKGTSYYLKPKDFFDLHDNFGNSWGGFEKKTSPKPRYEFNNLISIKIND